MKTDELIDALTADLPPAGGGAPARRIALAALAGGAAAVALAIAWLGPRPDLAQAAESATFWMKAAYATVLGTAGFLALERLSRPAGSGRRGLVLALAAVLMLVGLGAIQLVSAAPGERLALWLGSSWRRCPTNILALAAPLLALALLVARSLAPTRPTLAGGAAGLFAGGVAATAYGLHCPETAPAFVATWYTIGISLCVMLGAALGPLVLRWR